LLNKHTLGMEYVFNLEKNWLNERGIICISLRKLSTIVKHKNPS
jgi:hypothetical protein